MRGTLQSGQVLGRRYVIRGRLGEGGWGAVYSATQMDLGRQVAVKVLHTDVALSSEGLARFEREARAAAALGHPNIAQVTDFQAQQGEPPFLVMELLTGQTLSAALASTPKMPVARVAWIAHQILAALEAAHGAGIVHRDVKPDNVFLVSVSGLADFVKLLDFGIAKLAEDSKQQMTGTGAMMGSPAYMAPEQVRGLPVDARTDLYALGATMYRALTGVLPFEATNLHALMLSITERPFTPITQVEPSVDPAFAAVVERALHKDPAARFASAAEMRSALEPWSHGSKRGVQSGTAAMPAMSRAASLGSSSPLAGTTGPYAPVAPSAVPPPPPMPPTMAAYGGTPPGYASAYPAGAATGVLPPPAPEKKSSTVVVLLVAILLVVSCVAGAVFFVVIRMREASDVSVASNGTASATASVAPVATPTAPVLVPNTAATPVTKGRGVVRPAPVKPADAGAVAPVTIDAGAPRKQYAGSVGELKGGIYTDLPIEETKAAVRSRQAAINACYAATEFEPPDHQFNGWDVDLDPVGHAVAVRPTTKDARHPHLDACMMPILRSVAYPANPLKRPTTITLHFSARTRDNP